ncbi:MAG: hypothetical protein WD877_00800 [Candidatus Saccharimonadales bacterium]
MANFNRPKNPFPRRVESVDRTTTTAGRPKPPAWLVTVVRLVIILLLAALILLVGRWLYDKAFREADTPAPQPAPTTQPTTPPAEQTPPNQQPSAGNGTRTPTTGELPDSGPGEVLAIFVVASLTAALLHYRRHRRRAT